MDALLEFCLSMLVGLVLVSAFALMLMWFMGGTPTPWGYDTCWHLSLGVSLISQVCAGLRD